MIGRRITLFKLVGFEIRIDASWLIIVTLIIWSLAEGIFPLYFKGFSKITYWWMGIIGALGLFLSIVLHELSHSLVARRFGISIKGITLFIFGGVAEMDEEPSTPKSEFFMAIAGPLASILIGLVFMGLAHLGKKLDWHLSILIICSYLSSINFLLALFNLVPAFPLDGGRVFRSVLWKWKGNIRWATRVASYVGSGFGILLIVTGIYFIFTGSLIGGIWWALIGMFLRSASRMSYQSTLIRNALWGAPVSRFMKKSPVIDSADITISRFVEDYVYKYHYKLFAIINEYKPVSIVATRDIKQIPRDEWDMHTVFEIVQPCNSDNTILMTDESMKALTVMTRTGYNNLLVVDNNGNLVGNITLKDLRRFLLMKFDLDDEFSSVNDTDE